MLRRSVSIKTFPFHRILEALRVENERKMNAMETRSLRRKCGVSLADRIRNEEVHRIGIKREASLV